jgi:hypothetical protein
MTSPKSNIWLDLELREDIDDYLTLVYALEQKKPINVVSIHNPSNQELKLLKHTVDLFKSNAFLVVSGAITDYPPQKDIHHSLLNKVINQPLPTTIPLDTFLESHAPEGQLFFCGGSLYTLAKTLQAKPNNEWIAYIQGGYAGPSVVGEENVLKKFSGRESVPTWNLNLDLKSSQIVLSAKNVRCFFVSKNVCHNAWVDKKEINDSVSEFNRTLTNYFSQNKWSNKCMHDLLAFLTIDTDNLVTFSRVTLEHSNDERVKWKSILDEHSNKSISISFDRALFTHIIKTYRPKT